MGWEFYNQEGTTEFKSPARPTWRGMHGSSKNRTHEVGCGVCALWYLCYAETPAGSSRYAQEFFPIGKSGTLRLIASDEYEDPRVNLSTFMRLPSVSLSDHQSFATWVQFRGKWKETRSPGNDLPFDWHEADQLCFMRRISKANNQTKRDSWHCTVWPQLVPLAPIGCCA